VVIAQATSLFSLGLFFFFNQWLSTGKHEGDCLPVFYFTQTKSAI